MPRVIEDWQQLCLDNRERLLLPNAVFPHACSHTGAGGYPVQVIFMQGVTFIAQACAHEQTGRSKGSQAAGNGQVPWQCLPVNRAAM